jgi:tRNA(Ile)-lysidine synthase
MDVPCIVRRADLSHHGGKARNGSLQQRARQLRYRIMSELASEQKADKVALGHTADDQAETILLWLLRGAGLTGLAGMPHVRDNLFVRPLLTIPRSDLLAYLSSQAIEFRMDSSNAASMYRRNKIRHELLPRITALAPSFVSTMRRQSEVLAEEDRLLEQLVNDILPRLLTERAGRLILDRTALLNLPLALQRRVVRRLLRQWNGGLAASFKAVESILRQVATRPSGAGLSVGSCEVRRDGRTIVFMRLDSSTPRSPRDNKSFALQIPGTVWWPDTNERITVIFISEARARSLMQSASKRVAVLDASTFTPELTVRGWRHGDRFAPAGMRGHQKKLQDFFTDVKVTRFERLRIPLLTAPEGIVWVPGYRADDRFRAQASTQAFAVATLSDPAHCNEEGHTRG